MKGILSCYVNLLVKLSLSQSILITIFTSWNSVGEVSSIVVSTFPASGGLLTKAWRNRSMISGVLSEVTSVVFSTTCFGYGYEGCFYQHISDIVTSVVFINILKI